MPAGGSFRSFVEQKLGRIGSFMLYAVLEWTMIFLLFVDGLFAFFCNEFARFFELRIPCLLCTRIDHLLVHRNPNFYYNDSICDSHKKDVSSLAYCHTHKKLSDIRNMCEGCLLSFSTEKDSDCEKYNSFVGVFNKDVDSMVDDDRKLLMKPLNKKDDVDDKNNCVQMCSCCGEPQKPKSSLKIKHRRNLSTNAPTPSPRAPLATTEFENQIASIGDKLGKLLLDTDREVIRTPHFIRANKFFGIPLSDSPQPSPTWGNRRIMKSYERIDLVVDPIYEASELDVNALDNTLKKNLRSDSSKSLMAVYMDLDEERSASAIAANNAMAMITRLQAEKAAVHMEASQYQRMMEEQAEYDQEALREMKDIVLRREEEMKVLENELETYREKYGMIKRVGSEICEVDGDEYYQDIKSQSLSSFSEKSECGSLSGIDERPYERSMEFGGDESSLDFEGERSFLLGLLKNIEIKMNSKALDDEGSIDSSDTVKSEGNENKVSNLTREMNSFRERLRAIEAESGFLKHAAMTLQRGGDDGTKLLDEIAQHLRNIRHSVKSHAEAIDVA